MSAAGDRKVVFALLGIAALCLIGLGLSLYPEQVERTPPAGARAGREGAPAPGSPGQAGQPAGAGGEVRAAPGAPVGARARAPRQRLHPHLPEPDRVAGAEHQQPDPDDPPEAPAEAGPAEPPMWSLTIRPESSVTPRRPGPSSKAPKAGAAPKPELPYDQVPIELRTEGSYWTVLSFLEQLKQFPKMIAVNDISLQPKQAGTDAQTSSELTAAMDLTAVVAKGERDGPSR